jgi:hypothetical protein
MNKSRFVAVVLLATASTAQCTDECSECASIIIGDPIPPQDFTPDLEPAQFAKTKGVDYASLLQKALAKDPDAFREFFRQTNKLQFDGAYGELHAMVALHLLLRWGDVDFARATHKLDSASVDYLAAQFRQQRRFAVAFPDTAKALGITE